MSPADRTNQIVDEVCRKHFLSRDRLLAPPYRNTSCTNHYRKVTHYARAELAWRLFHQRNLPTRLISDLMNRSKRSVFSLIAIWAERVEWQAQVERLAA